jgi:hypothetical protein
MSIYICFSDRSKKLQIFLSFCVMSLGSFDRSKNLQIFLSFCVMSLGSFDNIFDTGKIFLVQFNYYLFFFFFFCLCFWCSQRTTLKIQPLVLVGTVLLLNHDYLFPVVVSVDLQWLVVSFIGSTAFQKNNFVIAYLC